MENIVGQEDMIADLQQLLCLFRNAASLIYWWLIMRNYGFSGMRNTEFLIKKESREIRKISKQDNEVFIQALEF